MTLFGGKPFGPKEDLGISAGVLLLAIALWYFLLYSPVQKETAALRTVVASQEDSLQAINRYKANVAMLNTKVIECQANIATWDGRFPARTEIVNLATQILNFGSKHNLDLVEMKPSLFELYALEKAGAHMSGRYVMQLPLNCRFRGAYLDLGEMLEDVSSLPFNLSIADVSIKPVPHAYPQLDFRLRLYLYVHL